MADTDNSQIDEQLAADIDARAVTHLKELVIPQIQKECDVQEANISGAWQAIQDSINTLSRKKQIIFTTLKKKESAERARQVFDDEVWNMMPPTLKKIQEALQMNLNQNKADHLPSPVVSPRPNKLDEFDRRSFTFEAGPSDIHESMFLPSRPARFDGLPDYSAMAETPNTTPSKRKKNVAPTTPGSPQKKARQSNICQQNATSCTEHTTAVVKPTIELNKNQTLPFYEVEGRDYLFQDPKVGEDWLCIRCCITDEYFNVVRFAQHPLESGCALDHFNKKTAKCHDTSRSYTWDDILKEFAYRVDEDLTEEKVKESNDLTRVKAAAKSTPAKPTPKGKGKAKTKSTAFSPANRVPVASSYAPEADMGLNNEDKLVNEAIEEVLSSW